jgi:cysteine dioxygenase
MVLCWKPGQGTPIHTHNGQLGWAFTTRGALECVEYRYMGCDRPENQNVAGLDCLAGGMRVKLDRTSATLCTPGGGVSRVTRQVTIHALAVPADCKEKVISFHVYSLPFDSCVVFDVAQGRCRRRDLAFDSAPAGYSVRMR